MALKSVTVAPKGMGLNDFVAQQEGVFAAEGLDVTLDWKTFRGTQSSWKDLKYFERLRLGQHLQRQRRHEQVRAGGVRRLAVGDLRAPGFEDPHPAGSQGHSHF